MSPTSALTLVVRGATATMAVSGELDAAATERLRAVVGAISDVPGIVNIEIDGRDITFVDPAGLRALLLTRVDAQLAGVSWNLAVVVDSPAPVARSGGGARGVGGPRPQLSAPRARSEKPDCPP